MPSASHQNNNHQDPCDTEMQGILDKSISMEERMRTSREKIEDIMQQSELKSGERQKEFDIRRLKMTEELEERRTRRLKEWEERRLEMSSVLEKRRREINARFENNRKKYESERIIPERIIMLYEEKDGLDIAGEVISKLQAEWRTQKTEEDKEKIHQALLEIKEAITSGNIIALLSKNYLHLNKGVHYYGSEREKDEIRRLERIYESNWSGYDPEWINHLIGKFRESLAGEHSFSVLRFQNEFSLADVFNTENIAWFLRITPYKKSTTDKRAVYLWAVNIADRFQWFSLLRYMLQETLQNTFVLSDEVYLHTVPGTDSEKIWFTMGFEDRWIIEAPYGKDGTKKMPLRLMCLKKDVYQKMTEKNRRY